MQAALVNSPHLVALPAVQDAVEVTPQSYATWVAMFAENATRLDFLLRPGDYRGLGRLEIKRPGNTRARPKTLRYHNPGVDDLVHPVKRSHHALIDAFLFERPVTQNWMVHGLTVSRPEHNCAIAQGAAGITVDFCLIEYGPVYSLRIRQATDCTVQRCVIRESINQAGNQGAGDSSGIQIGNIPADVLGMRILDNEIYNVGDGIQLTHHEDTPRSPVEVTMEGNDIYLEPSRYIGDTNTTWDENAIDLKAGSDTLRSTVIRNNRMWGFRRNAEPTALGELLVIQKYCRNLVVENNIMGDAPRAMLDLKWPPGEDVNKPRNIVFRGNQFYEIRDYAAADAGAITHPITAGISFVENHFARSDFLAAVTPPIYRGGGPVFRGNVLVEVGAVQRPGGHPSLVLRPGDENVVATAPHGFATYERRRWTGPESAAGAIPLVAGA